MKEEFKDVLQKIKENEYKLEDIDKKQLLEDLLELLGIHDPDIRDGLGYPVLAHLLHDSHFDKETLVDITKRLLSQEFLFFDIDNDIEFSTLIRSFAMLQLTVLIYVHNRDALYDKHEFEMLFENIVRYYKAEKDVRGFAKEVGFIHAIAHTADALHQIVKAKESTDHHYRLIMDVINYKFDRDDYVFVDDEDERTVNVLEEIIKENVLEKEYLLEWVNLVGEYKRPTTYPEVYRKHINLKNLLRSLYFRFIKEEEYNFLTDKIKEVLLEKVKLK